MRVSSSTITSKKHGGSRMTQETIPPLIVRTRKKTGDRPVVLDRVSLPGNSSALLLLRSPFWRGEGEGSLAFARACVLLLVFLGFLASSIGVVAEQMLMLLGVMVSRSLPLLVGGVAGANERLVESKQLERWCVTSWHGGGHRLLMECDDGNCCWSAEEGTGFSCLFKGGVVLALDRTFKRLRGLLRPMFLSGYEVGGYRGSLTHIG
jgi:hypothetical protein